MEIYSFSRQPIDESIDISGILQAIAGDTDTSALVVAVYYSVRTSWTGGVAYVRSWMTPRQLHARRGKWAQLGRFALPAECPEQFKLIRMLLNPDPSRYPRRETDMYHWQHDYRTLDDHLAHLFAHELHHYRRYHLGLHPGEGEHSANKWALQRAVDAGFTVSSRRLKTRKPKRRQPKPVSLGKVYNPADFNLPLQKVMLQFSASNQKKYITEKLRHIEELRSLPAGSRLRITWDPNRTYLHQTADLVRVMKRNSLRIVIRTRDGREWRWPMAWLEIA